MSTSNNTLIGGVVAVSLAVLLAITFMLPILSNAAQTEDTFTNKGGFYPMQEIKATDEGTYTLEWVKSDTTVLTINGVDFDAYETYGQATTTVLCGENWLVRYNSTNQSWGYFQVYDGTSWLGSNTSKAMSITATGGTMTATHTEASDAVTTRTYSYQTMYAIDPTATDDIMKKSTDTPYVLGDSPIVAMGVTNGVSGIFRITGNIDDGVSIDLIGNDTETISDIVITSTEVNGYLNLYQIEKITFNVTINDTTTACTYSYFIVPYEVIAERAVHFDSAEIALIEIIPILVIAGLILGLVGYAIRARLS